MTIGLGDLALYAGALVILFFTPGPVWVALTARALSGGMAAAWPLAAGVMLGDALWPLLAILGVSWVVSAFAGFMVVLKWVAAGVFVLMGALLIRHADRRLDRETRLTRPGVWAGFAAGVAVILGNPKAILFYMGVLPGFFDLTQVTAPDIAAVVATSMAVPLIGNLCFALGVDRARRVLNSPSALRRINVVAGWMLIGVGCILPLT